MPFDQNRFLCGHFKQDDERCLMFTGKPIPPNTPQYYYANKMYDKLNDLNMYTLLYLLDTQEYKKALQLIGDSQEFNLLKVQFLLLINRIDLAKGVKFASSDSVESQLAQCYIHCYCDQPKDAFYIYQELIEMYGSTPLLAQSQQACEVLMGKANSTYQKNMSDEFNSAASKFTV